MQGRMARKASKEGWQRRLARKDGKEMEGKKKR
jgi:hypothetical protein